jgi:TetR/AcrR family transcriptional regulator, repressor for uid operon
MGIEMKLISTSAGRRPGDAERRERILAAAERAFVRHGFHATTMQHVADEIGMSAGNLYRYFPSKEAIVEGLCERDQAERARAFGELMADNRSIPEALCSAVRKHVLARPPAKARMIVEIWAEAGRNPRVAEITRTIDDDVMAGLEQLMDAAKAAGSASPRLDSRFGARFFFTFVAGLFKRMAIEPGFDPSVESEMAVGVLKALFAGALSPDPAAPSEGI